MSEHNDGFETRAIHAGQDPEPITGAVITPIFQTSTYAQPSPGDHTGYEYSRTDNPTRTALQEALASLEGAQYGYAFSSGLAAEDTVLRILRAGDHIVLGNDAYGGTFRLISQVVTRAGITWWPSGVPVASTPVPSPTCCSFRVSWCRRMPAS